MTGPRHGPWNSGAKIDMTTIVLMIDAEALKAALAIHAVELTPFSGAPRGLHPVCIDLWHVEAGRLESAGLDQHTWSATTTAATAAFAGSWLGAAAGSGLGALGGAATGTLMAAPLGPIAWWWGTAAGWVAGGTWGAAVGASVAAARGAAIGADVGRGWSEAVSRTLGTYDEALVAVPNAVRPGTPDEQYLFVLGMCSNGIVSIWGDRALGFGYRKGRAEIVRDGFHRYEIRRGDRYPSLSAALAPAPRDSWVPYDARLDGYAALFARPLLGCRGQQGMAATFLDRFVDRPEVRWAPVSGRLEIESDFIVGLPGGEFDVPALSPGHPWGAFQAASVVTKVTDPDHD